jgi:hypothetical protein
MKVMMAGRETTTARSCPGNAVSDYPHAASGGDLEQTRKVICLLSYTCNRTAPEKKSKSR